MNNIKGFFFGILSSATFGLIPLFTLPVMEQGMRFDSILFYRFLLASIAIGIVLLIRKQSLKIRLSEIPALFYLSIFYVVSALFLFWGYNYLPSGIATTIHFLYPVFVTLIMTIAYHEKNSILKITAILMAICGVACLSIGENDREISLVGIGIVLVSAIGYALYIVRVNKSRVKNMPGMKLTFYVFLFGSVLFLLNTQINGGLQVISNGNIAVNLALLAIIPTIISNLALVQALKNIGSTLTAILGAMEPLTAVCVGIIVFHEPFSVSLVTGFILIITAVTLIILSHPLEKVIRQLQTRIYRKQK